MLVSVPEKRRVCTSVCTVHYRPPVDDLPQSAPRKLQEYEAPNFPATQAETMEVSVHELPLFVGVCASS